MIIKLFIFNFFIKKVELANVNVVFLLDLVVIINKSLYNQAYIFDYRILITDKK